MKIDIQAIKEIRAETKCSLREALTAWTICRGEATVAGMAAEKETAIALIESGKLEDVFSFVDDCAKERS